MVFIYARGWKERENAGEESNRVMSNKSKGRSRGREDGERLDASPSLSPVSLPPLSLASILSARCQTEMKEQGRRGGLSLSTLRRGSETGRAASREDVIWRVLQDGLAWSERASVWKEEKKQLHLRNWILLDPARVFIRNLNYPVRLNFVLT